MSGLIETFVVILQAVSAAALVYGLVLSSGNGLSIALKSVKGRVGAGLVNATA